MPLKRSASRATLRSKRRIKRLCRSVPHCPHLRSK